jgi:Cu2+-exporting ATPase
LPTLKCPEVTGKWLLLANDMKALMWIQIADSIRPEAEYTIKELSRLGLSLELLSGDNEIEVSSVAKEIGLKNYRSSMSPDDKLKYVQALQAEGKKVLMIGDGINDVPVLSGADVSMAMSGATDLAQTRADSILLDNNLTVLLKAFSCAELTTKIIKQNLSWAVSYNILALPLAAMAFIPPYAAAAGMSLSSLIVVANALRISKKEPDAVQAGL